MDLNTRRKRSIVGAVILCTLTWLAFSRSLQNGFINYDDGDYVTKNPHVLSGLTWANVKWALTSTRATNWNPVTWWSHMLDVQLFGLNPAAHHLVSLLWHVANTVILLWLLQWLTGAFWRSLFASALFAVHPLHVESVAWVSERKDLLSTFFFLLAIWAYAAYARARTATGRPAGPSGDEPPDPSAKRGLQKTRTGLRAVGSANLYGLSLVCYALGLMSKPILVTVPFVLLLLDFWPLSRLRGGLGSGLQSLLAEKIPFFCLTVGSCVATVLSQSQNYSMSGGLPLNLRLGTAVSSYLSYLAKTVWPSHLSIFYPNPNARYFAAPETLVYPASASWPAWQLAAGALLIVSISLLVLVRREQDPWWFTGWFWFLGTLVPVIGIVQAGVQVMADRYTYLPLIGIFIALSWTAGEFCASSPARRILCGVGGALVVAACGVVTWHQVRYWRDNRTVFTHALLVTPRNSMAEWMVGAAFAEEGKLGLAQTHFRLALAADPYQVEAHSALGSLFELEGRINLATNEYGRVLRMKPRDEFARVHLAEVLRKLGRSKEALAEYVRAARWNPDSVEANYQAGALLLEAGDLRSAAGFLQAALSLKPDHADALLCLADLRSQQGRPADAASALEQVVRLYPTNAELRVNFGSMLWGAGHVEQALAQYQEALHLNPSDPMIHYDLGTALMSQSKAPEAGEHFRQALRLKPDYPQAALGLARVLSAQRQYSEACGVLRQCLVLAPSNAALHASLGTALLMTGETNQASSEFGRASRLQPGLAEQYVTEGKSLLAGGQLNAALARFRTAVALKPDSPDALSGLAWLLAAHPRPEERDGARALLLAQHAVELAEADAGCWAALDAAYGETGNFVEAIKAAQKSKTLAAALGDSQNELAAQERIKSYQLRTPFHLKER